MFLRLSLVFILALAFSGCATAPNRTANEELQSRITELEKKMEAKDSQIVDLQYQVKDLSGKLESAPGSSVAPNPSAQESSTQATDLSKTSKNSAIVRVKAAPEDVQTALHAAGVYTGPIDGKIGAATKNAIVEFQKSHGLKADGILGKKTWEELKAFLK